VPGPAGVANKEDVLNGFVELVVGEVVAVVDQIEPPASPAEWKDVVRLRILAARDVLLRHRWAPGVFESRTTLQPALPNVAPEVAAAMLPQMAAHYPYMTELMRVVSHDVDTTLGGCDDQFEFGLDLILDGLERLRGHD
jgi:hypothetical protein